MALILCQTKWKHSRVVPQGLCSPYLVSRERLHSQEAVSDVDQGKNSLAFFFFLQFQKGGVSDKLRLCAGSQVVQSPCLDETLSSGKEPTCQCRRYKICGFAPWVGKIPWRRAGQSTPVFLPGESQGQRSLLGYSPRGFRVGHS